MFVGKSQEGTESYGFIGVVEKSLLRNKVSRRPKIPTAWYRVKVLDIYIINLYLMNFGKFVTGKS